MPLVWGQKWHRLMQVFQIRKCSWTLKTVSHYSFCCKGIKVIYVSHLLESWVVGVSELDASVISDWSMWILFEDKAGLYYFELSIWKNFVSYYYFGSYFLHLNTSWFLSQFSERYSTLIFLFPINADGCK